MQIIISGRHCTLDEPFKQFANARVEKLTRFYDRITEIDVVVEPIRGRSEVEIIVRADHNHRFFAKETHPDPQAALDLVAKDIEKQLARHKERHRNHKHPEGESSRDFGAPPAQASP